MKAKELRNKSRGFTGSASRACKSKNASWRGGRMGRTRSFAPFTGTSWPVASYGQLAQALL